MLLYSRLNTVCCNSLEEAQRDHQNRRILTSMAQPEAAGRHDHWVVEPALTAQVADICVDALVEEAAKNRVFEVIAQDSAPFRPIGELFASVAFRT